MQLQLMLVSLEGRLIPSLLMFVRHLTFTWSDWGIGIILDYTIWIGMDKMWSYVFNCNNTDMESCIPCKGRQVSRTFVFVSVLELILFKKKLKIIYYYHYYLTRMKVDFIAKTQNTASPWPSTTRRFWHWDSHLKQKQAAMLWGEALPL